MINAYPDKTPVPDASAWVTYGSHLRMQCWCRIRIAPDRNGDAWLSLAARGRRLDLGDGSRCWCAIQNAASEPRGRSKAL